MSVFKAFCYLYGVALLSGVPTACSPSEDSARPRAKREKEPAFEQVGKASWYGPGFHGKETSNGGVYDQNGRTAAHRSLPLGTEVEVTDIKTGKSVDLEITDRGPYVKGRVIDLSRAAAVDLGIKDKGLATVKVEADSVPNKKGKDVPSKDGKRSRAAGE
jgi:rare lipoprotein A